MNENNNCPICDSSNSEFFVSSKVQMQNNDSIFSFHKCLNCDSIYLYDPPKEQDLSHFYDENYLPYSSDNIWGKYTNLVKKWQLMLDKRRTNFLLDLNKKFDKETRILDFGCGHPSCLYELEKKTGWKCFGYDFSNNGWIKYKNNFDKINLYSGDFNEIEFKNKFNIITMWHSLEHHFNPKQLLKRLHDISLEESLLIIEVPNFNSLSRKIQKENWAGFHTPRHSVIYSPKSIELLLENSGWKVERILNYGTLDAYIFWWLGEIEKKNISKNEIKSLEKYFSHFLLFKVLYFPIFLFEKYFSFGLMTIICSKK